MNKWYVYIAESRTHRFYVGITKDVALRIERHNNGRGSRFAINQGPFVLVYSSMSMSKSEARRREIQIKGWSRSKKEKLITGMWE